MSQQTNVWFGGIDYARLQQVLQQTQTQVAGSKTSISVLSAATVTASGSSSVYSTGINKVFFVVISVGSVSGTNPSMTVYFNAYDSASGASIPIVSVNITAAGAYYISVSNFAGTQFTISWTVSGTSPSFDNVYITVYASP
jgi:hypothetical protein